MGKRMEFWFIFSSLVLGAICLGVMTEPVEDKEALLDFLGSIHHSHTLNWDRNSAVCQDWHGVFCNRDQSRVVAIRVPGAGILGPIPPNTLSRLNALEILSMRRNRILGPFPSDFTKLGSLTELYLQHNKFSGPLPKDFSSWKNLRIVDLSNNAFSGNISHSISNLTHLFFLNLANNSISGEIPDVNLPSLQQLNLANNNLSGNIPKSLQRFPSWVFSGNNISLAVVPPPAQPLQPPSSQPKEKAERLSEPAILGISLGGCVFAFMVVALFMVFCFRKRSEKQDKTKHQKKDIHLKKTSKREFSENLEKNKLYFFEGCSMAFNLEDLLRSSAEALGKGTFGVTYKAALEDTPIVAVKRLKGVKATKREFEQQMQILGSIKHENVVPLRAYYHSEDEKLAVYDYYQQGSVFSMLHGYGCISDVGLITLMNPLPLAKYTITGYRAPEVTDSRKVTHVSDVYSYGVFILELLTGRSPIPAPGDLNAIDLVRWVNETVRTEWTAEVFDVQLLKYSDQEEKMVNMMHLGLSCTSSMPEQRPNMLDVVTLLEDIRRQGTGDRPSLRSKTEASTSNSTPLRADKAFVSEQTQI